MTLNFPVIHKEFPKEKQDETICTECGEVKAWDEGICQACYDVIIKGKGLER